MLYPCTVHQPQPPHSPIQPCLTKVDFARDHLTAVSFTWTLPGLNKSMFYIKTFCWRSGTQRQLQFTYCESRPSRNMIAVTACGWAYNERTLFLSRIQY